MKKYKIMAIMLSLAITISSFASCGNSSVPGKKNDDEVKKTPESVELVTDDIKGSAEDVTAITGATDINGKVTDSKGITDKLGHIVYATGQVDISGLPIYTTGKKATTGEVLYTKNQIDTFGNLIYYTGKYDDKGKIELTATDESPDYTTNDIPKDKVVLGTTTTTTRVGADITSDITIVDATSTYFKYFGGSGQDIFSDVDADKDGGYVAVGYSMSKNGDLESINKDWADYNSMIVKYNADGSVAWKYFVGGESMVMLSKIAVLKDESIIAVGYTMSTESEVKLNSKTISAAVVRMSKDGKLMWGYTFPGDENSSGEYISSIVATSDGGFVVGGKAVSTSGFFTGTQENGTKAFLFKFDKNCNVKWRKILSGSQSNNITAVDVNSKGDIYATCVTASMDFDFSGIKYSGAATKNTVLMKFNKSGDLQWAEYLQGTGNSEYNAVTATSDNGCVVAGSFTIVRKADGIYSQNYGSSDGYVIRYTKDGDVRWARIIGGSGNDFINGIEEVEGGYAVVGQTKSTNADFQGQSIGGEEDGFLMYLNEKGETSTVVRLDGTSSDTVNSVATLSDGNIAICGWTKSKDNAFQGSNTGKQYKAYVAVYKTETSK